MRPAFTVFLLFFGIALLDAIRGGFGWRILFWCVVGAFFLWADRRASVRQAP